MKYLRLAIWLLSFVLLLLFVFIGMGCGGGNNNNEGNGGNDDGGNDAINYDLRIDRHVNVELGNARADQILVEMQNIINLDDGPGDVSCPVNFSRNGDVNPFSTGSGIINSQEDFMAVNSLPGQIKVVNQINWCGGIAPNIIGCAPVPGNSMVVTRFEESQEGILWLHEFGHNKGLNHRDEDDVVMKGVIGNTHKRVNLEECAAFQNTNSALLATSFYPASATSTDSLPVGAFVKQVFVTGVPYEEASKYGSKQLPELMLMLADSTNIKYWANIVVTLGIIGDDKAVDSIISLIKIDKPGEISRDLYNAKTAAIMALGYLINKSGNREALTFLKGCLNPHAWDESQPIWVSPFQEDHDQRNIQLSSIAILGLTLSGHPDAIAALETLKLPKEDEVDKKFQSQIRPTLDQSINDCQEIAKDGLLKYYQNNMRR